MELDKILAFALACVIGFRLEKHFRVIKAEIIKLIMKGK